MLLTKLLILLFVLGYEFEHRDDIKTLNKTSIYMWKVSDVIVTASAKLIFVAVLITKEKKSSTVI